MSKKTKSGLFAAVAAVLACVALVLWRLGAGEGSMAEIPQETESSSVADVEDSPAGIDDESTHPEDAPAMEDGGGEEEAETVAEDDDAEGVEESAEADEEERMVDRFDAFTDEFRDPVAPGEKIAMEKISKFREDFAAVPEGRREECLQRALNLLPDENVMLLAGILMDKSQPKEYLELVFNDILNRDESAKQAILEQVYADREHPCWADAAWILDATGTTPSSGVVDGSAEGVSGDSGGEAADVESLEGAESVDEE